MMFNFSNFIKIRAIFGFVFTLTAASNLHALPKQQTCEKITSLARAAMVVLSSVNKTENPKLDFATNAVRCLNSMAGNYYQDLGFKSVVSQEEQTAIFSFVASMVADIIKPEKLIDGKVSPKEQRTNARRAVLTMLALAESIPAICEAFRGVDGRGRYTMARSTAKTLRDVSAFAAVLHSIAATDDKYTKAAHASVLALMMYSWTKNHVFAAAEGSKKREIEKQRRAAEDQERQRYEAWVQDEEQRIAAEQDVSQEIWSAQRPDGFIYLGHPLRRYEGRVLSWVKCSQEISDGAAPKNILVAVRGYANRSCPQTWISARLDEAGHFVAENPNDLIHPHVVSHFTPK